MVPVFKGYAQGKIMIFHDHLTIGLSEIVVGIAEQLCQSAHRRARPCWTVKSHEQSALPHHLVTHVFRACLHNSLA